MKEDREAEIMDKKKDKDSIYRIVRDIALKGILNGSEVEQTTRDRIILAFYKTFFCNKKTE